MKSVHRLIHAIVLALLLGYGGNLAQAEEFGTPDEAKAMLARAVAAMQTNKDAAVAKFNHNDPAFRDRDLFVFCFNGRDGKFVAHEAFVGSDVRALVDRRGYQFGNAMFAAPSDGGIIEIAYVSPILSSTNQVSKRAYVSRVGNHVCGVSAYRFNGPGEPTQ